MEAAFDPPFPVGFAVEGLFFVAFDHQTPPSNRKIQRARRRLKDVFGHTDSTITPWRNFDIDLI
jgi:hypothetical protein